jgi:predicted RNA-binding Zn ribbon-like protein
MTAPGIADLPLVSGHPALDLVNTVEPRLPVAGRHEHLAGPDDVLTWARRAGLMDAAEGRAVARAWAASAAAGDRALTAVIQTREALAAVLTAVLSPPGPADPDGLAPDLEYLSLTWAAAASRSRLAVDPASPAIARLSVGSAPALLVPDRVAHAAVDLLSHVDPAHLGMCPVDAGGCGWVFIDRSRNRSRRWCTMGACGAFAKARRLTERRRAARSGYR